MKHYLFVYLTAFLTLSFFSCTQDDFNYSDNKRQQKKDYFIKKTKDFSAKYGVSITLNENVLDSV